MKRLLCFVVAVSALCGCSAIRNVNWDSAQLQNAAGNALTAVSLTDAQVAQLSAQTIAEMDAKNIIDNGAYLNRLQKVMAGIDQVEGLKLNYKVYKLDEVNAFACGDGSIRVYSGLMDVMDDDQLMAIIGHEIGHVVHKDTRNAMKSAYMAAAARGVVNAAGGTIGAISQTVLGDIAESYVSSKFSQKQEFNADAYGFNFAKDHGRDPYSMYNALMKLDDLAGNARSNIIQHMFSSHPDTQERAARVKAMADKASR
ncbi:MAG: M48 family metalloprotease [Bacteroidales bacterium]|nr:M48 family metalloprotease [Bacteroidales bacterium]